MIKKVIRYFRKRKEARLRKWCVEQAVKVSRNANEATYFVEYVYKIMKRESTLFQ